MLGGVAQSRQVIAREGERIVLKVIDVREAQARLHELLSQVMQGIELVLTQENKPIARVVPISSRVAGLHMGAIWTSADFDESLPDEFWAGKA